MKKERKKVVKAKKVEGKIYETVHYDHVAFTNTPIDTSSDFSLFTKLDTEHHVDRQRRPHLPNQNYKLQNSSFCLAYLDHSRSY